MNKKSAERWQPDAQVQKIPSIIRIAAGVRVARLFFGNHILTKSVYRDYTVRPPSPAMSLLRELEFIRQLAEGIFAVASAAILVCSLLAVTCREGSN